MYDNTTTIKSASSITIRAEFVLLSTEYANGSVAEILKADANVESK